MFMRVVSMCVVMPMVVRTALVVLRRWGLLIWVRHLSCLVERTHYLLPGMWCPGRIVCVLPTSQGELMP